MKNLLLISILTVFLSGCSYRQFSGFKATHVTGVKPADVKPWFSERSGNDLFRAGVDLYKHHFSGIMVMKATEENSTRVVFLTEVGMKIFDLEFFRKGEVKLHYCPDALNKKFIINTLTEDLRLIMDSIPENEKLKISSDPVDDRLLFRTKTQPGKFNYIVDSRSMRIEKIVKTGSFRKKTEITFISNNRKDLDSIAIKHFNFKLQIHLSRLRETNNDVPE